MFVFNRLIEQFSRFSGRTCGFTTVIGLIACTRMQTRQNTNFSFSRWLASVGLIVLFGSYPVIAQTDDSSSTDRSPEIEQLDRQKFETTVNRGLRYLLDRGQAPDGSFSKNLGPAITSLCVRSLLEHGIELEHPQVQKGLRYLESTIQSDGGIYQPGSVLRNYETSVALMCFVRANKDGRYDETIRRAVAYLKGLQFSEVSGHEITSDFFGGVSYDVQRPPDMSNLSFFLDALEAAGEDGDSETVQKALVFMARSQNLPSQYNNADWALKVAAEDRGGFIYTAADGGESKAGSTDAGGLRSYASMTYAGLKSFLYAGVSKDDIRVKAALDWIRRNYSLESNPGMGQQGLFYYYHVFAKALHTLGEPIVVDANGIERNWRNDLVHQLSILQNDDGSWTNPADRWYEGDPNLVTSYAMLALSYCKPEKE